jgi:uncharacterized protein (DUF302 family)
VKPFNRRQFISRLRITGLFFLPFKMQHTMEAKGVSIRKSPYAVKDSIDRLVLFLQERGATVYARINQQAEAAKAGIMIAPLQFVLFGNPKGGGILMAQTLLVALDLPLKVIAWEDDKGDVWIGYNAAHYIEDRYSLDHNVNSPLNLDNIMEALFKTPLGN